MDKTNDALCLSVNPQIGYLLLGASWSKVNVRIRQALGADQLAKWLHGFYCTHNTQREKVFYSVQKLKDLCGSEDKQLRNFRLKLQKALDKIAEAYQAQGKMFTWSIDQNDNVIVSTTETPKLQ
ncbi:hypothetical protein [Jonquetella anthropi]|uniref:hypothetical protein n=1 Tax=Jonquetella anthropi TaxID=428712 RepID=UPI0023F46D13|nr:hypothetical protein [Jonquetella anthropi]